MKALFSESLSKTLNKHMIKIMRFYDISHLKSDNNKLNLNIKNQI